MKLLKDSKNPGAFWKYDGVDHGIYAVVCYLVLIGVLCDLGKIHLHTGVALAIVLFFVVVEIFQELRMVKDARKLGKTRRFHFSQSRWQDIFFPAISLGFIELMYWLIIG
jgi:hypothetical protein